MNKYLKLAMININKRRSIAEIEATNNLNAAFALSPAFKELYYKRKEKLIDSAKAEVNGDNKKQKAIDTEIKKIDDEIKKLLSLLNLKWESLSPDYFCKNCSDTGYKNNAPCKCLKDEYLRLTMNEVQTTTIPYTVKFEDLTVDIFEDKEKASKNLLKAKEVLERFPNLKINTLLLAGPTGTGKTYLASAIANNLRARNFSVNFISSFTMIELFYKYHTTMDSSRRSFLKALTDVDALVIDDLGNEQIINNIGLSYLYLIINERILNKKLTIITTNFDAKDLEKKYDQRIFSRITDKKSTLPLRFSGADLRNSKKNNTH